MPCATQLDFVYACNVNREGITGSLEDTFEVSVQGLHLQDFSQFPLALARSDLFKGFAVGALAAMSGSAVSAPFDVIKVRMQIQGEAALAGAGNPLSTCLKFISDDTNP